MSAIVRRAVYVGFTKGQTWGRPPSGIESKYLLSGLMRCALCGASLTVRNSHGRHYICAGFDHRGSVVCQNNLRLPMAEADDAILTTMKDVILHPDVVEGAIVDAIAELRPSRAAADGKRKALQAELH